jgi:uncharacterized membrane protein YhfC
MSPLLLLTIQALVVLIVPVLWGWYVQRRTGASWGVWGWGALAFFVSQMVLRIPLLQLLTVLMAQLNLDWSEAQSFWFNLVLLTTTAALFEEGARWIVMRWRKDSIVRWRDGLMFGAGHGGIEAMLIVGLSAINGIIFLSSPDTIMSQTQTQAPDQLPAIQAVLAQLQSITPLDVGLGIYERVLAVLFHTAASLLVLKAVRDGKPQWWWAAFTAHVLFNGVGVLALEYGGVVAAEIAFTLMSVVSVWVVWWTYQQRHTMEPRDEVIAETAALS